MSESRWLDREAVADYISKQPHDIRRLVRDGRIPPPTYHLGQRSPRWDKFAVDAAMSRNLQSFAPRRIDEALEAIREEAARSGNRNSRRTQAPR